MTDETQRAIGRLEGRMEGVEDGLQDVRTEMRTGFDRIGGQIDNLAKVDRNQNGKLNAITGAAGFVRTTLPWIITLVGIGVGVAIAVIF